MHRHWIWATLGGLLALTPALVPAKTLYYMSPSGSDSNTGIIPKSPLKTLNGALTTIKANKTSDAIDIVIIEGTYLNQSVVWDYFNDQPITFRPPGGATTKPVFDGEGTGLTWFTMADSPDDGAASTRTNLRFVGLKVTNYWLALELGQNKRAGNSFNQVREMLFERIGPLYTRDRPQATGYAALRLRRSSNNTISGNRFHGVKNGGEELASYIHAVYAAFGSRGNVISDNEFNQVTGDAVRTRDASDDNLVEGNLFVKAGKYSAYSDWVDTEGTECPSRNNRFTDNTVGEGYFGPYEDGLVTRTWGPDERCAEGGVVPERIIESGTVQT